MKNNNYNKLKQLAKYINQLIATGRWTTLGEEKQNKLRHSLNRLVGQLKNLVSKRKLARVLGAAVMLISANASAQSFAPPISGAFSMTGGGYFVKPELVDIDNDGDLDFFQYDTDSESLLFQENIGSAEEPDFGEVQMNPFGFSGETVVLFPIFGDLDGDGDYDMLASNYDEGIPMYYENTGTSEDADFGTAPVMMPFGLTGIYILMNDLVDIDDDGDLDLFTSSYDETEESGLIYFYENTGTDETPNFATPEGSPFGLTVAAEETFLFIDFADFDGDGDLDFMRNEMYGNTFYYHENEGDAEEAEYAAGSGLISPFDLTPLTEGYFFSLSLADIDADGDYDLFAAEYETGGNLFYENQTINVGLEDLEAEHTRLEISPNPAENLINISTELVSEDIEVVQLLALDGRIVYQSNQFTKTIDVSDLPAGMYVIRMQLKNGAENREKFIKN